MGGGRYGEGNTPQARAGEAGKKVGSKDRGLGLGLVLGLDRNNAAVMSTRSTVIVI